jgi:hypothetical protein
MKVRSANLLSAKKQLEALQHGSREGYDNIQVAVNAATAQ